MIHPKTRKALLAVKEGDILIRHVYSFGTSKSIAKVTKVDKDLIYTETGMYKRNTGYRTQANGWSDKLLPPAPGEVEIVRKELLTNKCRNWLSEADWDELEDDEVLNIISWLGHLLPDDHMLTRDCPVRHPKFFTIAKGRKVLED